ncbi:MAG: shikimate dehydrogenase [Proteobacteria bacterium]|nr:shikimate dehydrogenase [Pseudomonadota bacterium]
MPPISASTKFCAVIGNPISHSLSPAIHNAAFQELGLDFVYLACRVEDVKGALAGMRALENFRGLSVTIPHKIEIMKYCDEINDVDRSIGSINTVIHEGDKLLAMGTDGPGALKALTDAGLAMDGKTILMLGAGGAARAIAFTLARDTKAVEITLLDLNESTLKGLASDLNAGTSTRISSALMTEAALAEAMERADIIINCTPVGMHPNVDASVVPVELFRPGQAVFDVVYTPLQTKLLRDAASKGLKTVSGVEMFINQAALQFEQFTGKDAPVEVMRRVVMEHLKK